MEVELNGLNQNQRLAVEWSEGPLLVLAGPGSGKTRVLTLRIAKLINDTPDQRFRILGLTFTNKAASEMKTRVDEMLKTGRERALLTTFHSLSADILRQHGSHIGVRPDFTILNQEADREAVLFDAIKALQGQGVEIDEQAVKTLPWINNMLEHCVAETEIESQVTNKAQATILSSLFSEYRRQLLQNNRMDFPSLIYCTDQLLNSHPAIARHMRIVYRHVCVDEFQDTNLAQYRLLRAIVGENPKNIFVVADDDQIIYQWNGASPERLKELRQDFNMHVVQLPANYRCTPAVIGLANKLISHNLDRSIDKEPLYAMKEPLADKPVYYYSFDTLEDEVSGVAQDILIRPENERPQCAILARTKKLLEAAFQALDNVGIKVSLAVKKNEFESEPFRWLHAMLRLANSRADREQLRRVCKSFYELEGESIEVQDVIATAAIKGGDFLRSWLEKALERQTLAPQTRTFLTTAGKNFVDRQDFFSFISKAFEWFGHVDKQIPSTEIADVLTDFVEEKTIWEGLQKQICEKFGRENVTLQILLQEFDLAPKSPPIHKLLDV